MKKHSNFLVEFFPKNFSGKMKMKAIFKRK